MSCAGLPAAQGTLQPERTRLAGLAKRAMIATLWSAYRTGSTAMRTAGVFILNVEPETASTPTLLSIAPTGAVPASRRIARHATVHVTGRTGRLHQCSSG